MTTASRGLVRLTKFWNGQHLTCFVHEAEVAERLARGWRRA